MQVNKTKTGTRIKLLKREQNHLEEAAWILGEVAKHEDVDGTLDAAQTAILHLLDQYAPTP